MGLSEEVERLRADLERLKAQEDKTIDVFRGAQHNLFILADQDAHPNLLETARTKAVAYYEAYLDLTSEIRVKEKRFNDLMD